MNLRLSASANGTRNTFDNTLNFSSFGGSPAASGATNNTAVASFNTAYAALSGRTRLIIDPGTYNNSSGFNFAPSGGNGNSLTIEGYGAILTAPGGQTNNLINPTGPFNDWTHHANFDTVSAGAFTIDLADTSLFTAGKWVILTAIDMQGYGYPMNPGIFEFKKIASKDAVSLTFTEPLINSYKSTYPNYEPGNPEIYLGGPATVYVLRDSWDQEIEVKGIRFTDTANLTYAGVRVAQWVGCTFDTYGPCPSMNLLYRSIRCIGAGTGALEVDKCVHRMEFIDSMHRAVDFQSASINELYVSNMTQSPNARWRGGASKSNTFIDLNTTTFEFGEMNYGAMGPTTMTNCTATTGTWHSANFFPFADYTEEGGGVLSYAGGPGPATANNVTAYWAVPGNYCVLLDNSLAFAQSFQVTDVSSSGGRTYVTTTLPFPLPGTINGKSPPWKIANHPCADLTMVNCSGNSLFTTQSALPANSPFNSWTL